MNPPIPIPVFPGKRIRAWPKNSRGGRPDYLVASDALRRNYATDAHFAAYSLPTLCRRLGVDALRNPEARAQLAEGIAMVLAVFDVDCEAAHAGDPSAADDWWLEELKKLPALLAQHPHGHVYRTRGGYRIVYALAEPIVLHDDADAEAWTARYCAWVSYLGRAFEIAADHACKDWTRLFRLPRATRDPTAGPENRETIGDAAALGAWICDPSAEDIEKARKLHKRRAGRRRKRRGTPNATAGGEGVLFHLFRDKGWVGAEVDVRKWAVVCPNESAHTSGESLDTSTVLFAPPAGESLGWLHCSHAHCQGRTVRDVVGVFTEEEIEQARGAAGLPPRARRRHEGEDSEPDNLRPKVYVPGPHHDETGDYIEVGTHEFTATVLAAIPQGTLYRMDVVVGDVVGDPGRRRFRQLDEQPMRQRIDQHARLVQGVIGRKTGDPTVVYKPCSRDLAGLVLAAAATSPGVRDLDLIAQFPVCLPGFELAQPGWNEKGRVYYDEPPELTGLQARADGALAVLDDLVVDFPFKDDASRQNCYGAMLSLLLRPAIEGPVPFHLVMASLERTGKGKLIDTAPGMAVTGTQVPPLQLSGSEEEREKRITSLLVSGAAAIHFDNVPGGEVLDSAALASLATAYPRWRGRLLGKSAIVSLPNRALVFMSGNNVRATGELCKRTVPIVLESKTPCPELRDDYLHPDCLEYAALRRRDVLEALLGLVEGWKSSGMPGTTIRMGGFERWADAVGGVLGVAGAKDWMTNYRPWVAMADDEGADAEALVREWARVHGESPITATQILEIARSTGTFSRVFVSPTVEGQRVSLGRRVLPLLIDRPLAGWIVRRTGSGSSSIYRLVQGTP